MEAYVFCVYTVNKFPRFFLLWVSEGLKTSYIYGVMKQCLLLFVTLLFGACCTSKQGQVVDNGSIASKDSTNFVLQQDSCYKLFKQAQSIYVYETMPFITDTTSKVKRDSLLSYPLKRSVGKISGRKLEVIKFLMSDKSQYVFDYPPVRQPFWPNAIFKLHNGKNTTYCMMSFGTHEIAFTKDKRSFIYAWMCNSDTLERWFNQYVLPKRN